MKILLATVLSLLAFHSAHTQQSTDAINEFLSEHDSIIWLDSNKYSNTYIILRLTIDTVTFAYRQRNEQNITIWDQFYYDSLQVSIGYDPSGTYMNYFSINSLSPRFQHTYAFDEKQKLVLTHDGYHGMERGTSREYYKNGQLKCIRVYDDDCIPDIFGECTPEVEISYYPSGQLEYVLSDNPIFYYETGQIRSKTVNLTDQIRERVQYYLNGQIEFIEEFNISTQASTEYKYSENGDLLSIRKYKNFECIEIVYESKK